MNTENIFIISGPSGAGEDSIINGLEAYFPLERAITTSTRSMRPGESQGNPYYFLSKEVFRKKIAEGAFAEYAEQYNGNLYGVTREELNRLMHSGNIGIWKIDYQGVATAKKLFPEIIAIMISAPLDILEERIRKRDNPSETFIRERMAYSAEWLEHTNLYDYVVENQQSKLDQAIEAVRRIIAQHSSVAAL